MRVTFLGSGTSSGNPVPTCDCEVCRSADPLDRRLRASVLVEVGERPAFGRQRLTHASPQVAERPDLRAYRALLIDCGPDFRAQALRLDLRHVTAVLLTHLHFDHCGGLDDLRLYSYARPLPLYAEPEVARVLRMKYDYVFSRPYPGAPHLRLREVVPLQGFSVGGVRVRPVRLMHGSLPVVGYRLGGLAYLTDCTAVPEASMRALRGLDTLVLDALRWVPHRTHFAVDEALDVVQRLRPRCTWLTHMSHDVGLHREAEERLALHLGERGLPPGSVHFAYDGLQLDVP